MASSTSEERMGPAVPETEDSRQMCFSQGKAFVYEPEDERGTIVTEWPNGVIDRHNLETKTTGRTGRLTAVTRMSRSSTRCGHVGGTSAAP